MNSEPTLPSFPRTLLLTLWAPDAKYTILRRYPENLPPDRICWCSLQPCAPEAVLPFRHVAAVPRAMYWRLQRTAVGWYCRHILQARALAYRIAAAVQGFEPELLWVLPQLGAAHVAIPLAKRLGIPIHMTSHDAHETARSIVPALYYPAYARAVCRVLGAASSLDAISDGLLEHHQRRFPYFDAGNAIVCHPPIDARLVASPQRRDRSWMQSPQRTIGLCGSMRVSAGQWVAFLNVLAALPYRFTIVALAYPDLFFHEPVPANVKLDFLPFAPTEADVIATLRQHHVDACYLGLWRGEPEGLFGRTSLSAKLTTYAASALPIIVDADADSGAWKLVSRYRAGVRIGDGADAARDLDRLLGDGETWSRAAGGAAALAMNEFNLQSNLERLSKCFENTVRKGRDA